MAKHLTNGASDRLRGWNSLKIARIRQIDHIGAAGVDIHLHIGEYLRFSKLSTITCMDDVETGNNARFRVNYEMGQSLKSAKCLYPHLHSHQNETKDTWLDGNSSCRVSWESKVGIQRSFNSSCVFIYIIVSSFLVLNVFDKYDIKN